MPEKNMHFPKAETGKYIRSWESGVRCVLMQGGQGETKHWAFNDPVKREGKYKDNPPTPEDYRKLTTRVVDLHPITCMENARTSGGGVVTGIPVQALTVGPVQTWKAEKVSIWHAGTHDNSFGQRLTALMLGKKIVDSSVPMSLLADHPNVQFNYYRGGLGTCEPEMH
jgi:glucosamine-6-phosphate deaminase